MVTLADNSAALRREPAADVSDVAAGPGLNVGSLERVASIVGGSALAIYGVRRKDAPGAVLALLGAALLHRGATGHCFVYEGLGVSTADDGAIQLRQQHGEAAVLDASKAIRVEHAVTIDLPAAELYRFWRNFENLPRIMRHLESVTVLDATRSRWKAKAPAGTSVEWDAVVHNEIPNQLIAWKSVDEAHIPNAGSVHFSDAPGGRGTEVRVVLEYQPPGGKVGQLVARLLGEEPDRQVREDLRGFKAVMETGEVPTTEGQPRGG
jgi:uncharacterized membrane protein